MDPVSQTTGRTQVLAHRGYHPTGIAENSLGAFRAGQALGVDLLELDVRRTRDGVLVIHHDAEVDGGRKIADLDYAQLPPLSDGQPIPTLAEVADFARSSGAHLAVELKEKGYEREAMAQLFARVPTAQAEVISFNRTSVTAVEGIDPSIRTGLLEPRLPEWLRKTPLYPAARWAMDALGWHPSLGAAAKVGADYVSIDQQLATPKFLADARERGVGVDVWTVDRPADMQRLLDEGVQGIVTNHPDVALKLRAASTLPEAPPLEAAS
ncbi:MAG: Glycerophosphoryl diester phosphodiesterase [Thermoleophilia bacterium]|nr:Glycerophosphoryl diester phosphodiesterase [Thermoleophilia bacterium]